MHADLQVPFEKGKTLSCAVTSPGVTGKSVGIILAHGAGGDMHSANLPQFAQAFANAGFVCLRFTCKPTQLAYRVRACQAVIDGAASSKHLSLEGITHWIFAGHSMVPYALSTYIKDQKFKDTMCEPDTFQAVRDRMSSYDVQVHEVEGGDHGLKVHAGKGTRPQTLAALQQVASLICTFANNVNRTSEAKVAKGKTTDYSSATKNLQEKTALDKPKAANKRTATATTQTRSKRGKFAC